VLISKLAWRVAKSYGSVFLSSIADSSEKSDITAISEDAADKFIIFNLIPLSSNS
jgi:hypothetical protein